MEIFKGIGVSHGVAVGEAFVVESERTPVRRTRIDPGAVHAEIQRFENAVVTAIERIRDDQRRLAPRLGEEYLAIFETHIRMLDDRRLRDGVIQHIQSELTTAEAAVDDVLKKHIQLLFEDKSTARWVSDLYDVQSRLHHVLMSRSTGNVRDLPSPVVIVADDLMPSQTVTFDREKILAITMEAGGATSHTAIIANALGIPAVVGLRHLTTAVRAGDRIIVDGGDGNVIVDPD